MCRESGSSILRIDQGGFTIAMNKIDGKMFKNMILSGAENLRQHAEYVDSLNVFPVPDGDTGTKMNSD